MTSVLADFRAHVLADTSKWDGAIEGRVLLSETQLVLARDETRVVVTLESIFDVTGGSQLSVSDQLPGRPVTVAFRTGSERATAVVSADPTTSEKFETVLFKALLNGTSATLKHPAKIGGRVLERPSRGTLLSLAGKAVRFDSQEGPLVIPLDSVVDFAQQERNIDGTRRPVLVVSHVKQGETFETLVATDPARTRSLLGRYLRGTYDKVLASLAERQLSERETEALVALYSTSGQSPLPRLLGTSPQRARRLVQALHEQGLVEADDGGPVLTAAGQILVNEYLERVNA